MSYNDTFQGSYLWTGINPCPECDIASMTSPGAIPTAAAGDEGSTDVIVTVSATVTNLNR